MVDTLFWPFAIKAVAERMNTLHVNSAGQTPESLMYDLDLNTVPLRNFHTLFCPICSGSSITVCKRTWAT